MDFSAKGLGLASRVVIDYGAIHLDALAHMHFDLHWGRSWFWKLTVGFKCPIFGASIVEMCEPNGLNPEHP